MGDIVLTTPVLRCLKKIPGKEVEVHFVTKQAFAGLLRNNPHVDGLHLLDGSLRELITRLKALNFDYLIDLHHNLRSALVKLALRRPTGSCRKLNLEKWLLTRFKINRLPSLHIVDRYFEAARITGAENDGQGLDFFFSGNNDSLPSGFPRQWGNAFAAFVIGGRHATKRLPNEKIAGICRRLESPVVLLGGADDAANGQMIAAAAGNKVLNACGMYSLEQSAAVVKKAGVVITHDTGLMHIAAAFGKQLISVWGNTVPGFGMVPYMPTCPERSLIMEVKGLSCRPCSKIGYAKCPKGHFDCMMKIDENMIADSARQGIGKPQQGQAQ